MMSNTQDTQQQPNGGVIPIPISFLFLSTTPLLLIILASWKMELDLESSILIGTIRTFVQLSILAIVLQPIFLIKNIYLVFGYCFIMIVLAARIACQKMKYVFLGQYYTVLISLLLSVSFTGYFAFAIIIRPQPLWNPQYVIPIVGMLLGNSVNGISITMNNLCIAFVESQREIELYLSFGATNYEAISRLLQEAVRSGTTPVLNSMAVIGIISIPGMMTGQILGGSPVMEAARYQMLIMYLIAVSSFGALLMQVWAILDIGFDSSHMLRPDRFEKASDSLPLLEVTKNLLFATFLVKRNKTIHNNMEDHPILSGGNINNSFYLANHSSGPEVIPLRRQSSMDTCATPQPNVLRLDGLKKSLRRKESRGDDGFQISNLIRTLFDNLSFEVESGDITLIKGPSGCGKTQLLRAIAGLSQVDNGMISLDGEDIHTLVSNDWRKKVRYVPQYKVDIPGTPLDFINRITGFKSWTQDNWPKGKDVLKSTIEFIVEWGLDSNILNKEWALLSGGEAQRVILAVSLASNPSVLLLDETTSALDLDSKIAVERSIDVIAKRKGLKILWVSHDPEIITRFNCC